VAGGRWLTGGARCEEGASKVILGFYLTWMFLGAACEKNRRRRRRPFLNVPSSKTSPSWQGQVPRPKSQRTNGASKNPGTHRHRECVEAFFSLVPLLSLLSARPSRPADQTRGHFQRPPKRAPQGPEPSPDATLRGMGVGKEDRAIGREGGQRSKAVPGSRKRRVVDGGDQDEESSGAHPWPELSAGATCKCTSLQGMTFTPSGRPPS